MTEVESYTAACEEFRKEHARLMQWAILLRDFGTALLAGPEKAFLENTPERVGVPMTIALGSGEKFQARDWPTADDLNRTITSRVEARLKCEKAYEMLPQATRGSVKKPSEVIAI